jgi:heme-degrading monooxygenase HmoA
MIVTILSGHVTEENWRTLEKSYEQAIRTGAKGILTSMLIQNQNEPKMWEIITTWHSEEDYKNAQEHKITHTCVGLFCNAGSTPHRNEYNVFGHYTRV